MKHLNLRRIKGWITGHKIISAIIVVAIVFIVYKIITTVGNNSGTPRYVFVTV
ncbi:MAG: hypothetical protein NT077_03160 [Candidatus Taylorbacteria bacterium]|nr:hypothetical protein [Candidatus Taylorbacteria bacterium]